MLMLQLRGLGALVCPGGWVYSIHTHVEPSELQLLYQRIRGRMGLEQNRTNT